MRLWEIFWEKELERPRRNEYYLMGVMAETRRPHVKNPEKVLLEDMRIRFKDRDKKNESDMTPEERILNSKRKWFGALGISKEEFLKEGQLGMPKRSIMQKKIRPNQT